MRLNCIWWWGSSSRDLESVEYPFTVITPRSSLTLKYWLWSSSSGLLSQLGLCDTLTVPLLRGKIPLPNKCCRYDTKQSDGEIPVMLELWRMQSTLSLRSLSGPLWLRVVALDRVLSMGWLELICILMLNWIFWNRTVLTSKLYYTKLNYSKENCFDV